MTAKPAYREDKLAELMLYVSAKCQTHSKFGSTKLNKVLFYSDFLAYYTWGKPITGAEYRRRPFGPAATKFLPVQRRLQETKAAVVQPKILPSGKAQQRLIPMRAPNLDIFEAKEISLIDDVIEKLKDMTADEVSDLTHKLPGWLFAEQNEPIPYFTVFLMDRMPPLSQRDTEWARSVVARNLTAPL